MSVLEGDEATEASADNSNIVEVFPPYEFVNFGGIVIKGFAFNTEIGEICIDVMIFEIFREAKFAPAADNTT